ncbi:protein C1orf43 homolog isoform X1 [Acropora muricata]|uniref:protein C1orf43 homolog isoform X1 n=1 Tax=Acropora millepora TaxID=45264 RepID=UPI0010FCAF3E|nr:protein C1orf43 homolog isoform X1 [Acropora millepora]
MAADSVSSTDAKLLKKLGGVGLVMTIIFAISIVIVIVILVKRQILRMLLLSKRGPHSPVGSDAPRSLGRDIAARLQRISQLRMEPRMLSEQFNKPLDGTANFESPSDQYTRSYKYRMKAMDKMTELDDLLCTIDFKYSRKKKQSVRDHLKSLQKSPYSVIRGGDDTINEVSGMYEHARYETKEFGALQYRKFAYLVEQLKDRVRLYVNVPGSLIVAGSSNKPIRKPPSSTKMEPVAAQDADTAATSKMTASGAIRL